MTISNYYSQSDQLTVTPLFLGPMDNISYIISDKSTKQAAIVDPAWDSHAFIQPIQQQQLSVQNIWITHTHFDHINAFDSVYDNFKCPVIFHPQASQKLLDMVNIEHQCPTSHQQSISLGEQSVTIHHTPGHSPDGQCFEIDPFLITGDTVFINGCGRCDLDTSDPDLMYDSLQAIKSLNHSLLICPGHHYGDTSIEPLHILLDSNPYLNAATRAVFLRKRMGIKPSSSN